MTDDADRVRGDENRYILRMPRQDRHRRIAAALRFAAVVAIAGALPGTVRSEPSGGTLQVVAVEPSAHALGASARTPIVVRFDRPVEPSTIDEHSFWAFGKWSGAVAGTYGFADGDRTIVLTPARSLSPGERVMVILSHDIEAADGSAMRDAGYAYQFWIRSRVASEPFVEIERLTTRTTPAQPTQAYGGIGSDLDSDGFLDVTIVNEITADLRVFMNRGDGTGGFDPFRLPTEPVGTRASPSEPSDFNRDGHVDICVANIDDDTVSILLGNGDGTFGPQQTVAVGTAPRGIAALDVDGDGDVDVVNTNSGSLGFNMSVILNDGNGVFGAPSFFPAWTAGAWALAAGDMNDDGILDLVIGSRETQRVVVQAGNGDGTFSPVSNRTAGGGPWMLVLGDLNGDGAEDVASVNGTSNNGSILLGDGSGGLGTPQVYATDPLTLASDVGDLDGDGDLDWITSSFSGDWWLYRNDGTGSFEFDREFDASVASSCALMLDLDGDGDLDLALIDEIADELILMSNGGFAGQLLPPPVPDGGANTVPFRVGRVDLQGSVLALTWDVDSCSAADYHLVHGTESGLPALPGAAYGPSGGRCGIGTDQPFLWLAAPPAAGDPTRLVWFLMLADDGSTTEGSWGTDSAGLERAGPGPSGASGECGMTVKDLTTVCSQR